MGGLAVHSTQSNFALDDLRDSEAAIARDLHRFGFKQLTENQHLFHEIQRNRMLQNQQNEIKNTRLDLASSIAESYAVEACYRSLSKLGPAPVIIVFNGHKNSSRSNISKDITDVDHQKNNLLHKLDMDIAAIYNISVPANFTLAPLLFTEDNRLFNFSHDDFFGNVGYGINSLEGLVSHGLDDVKDVVDNTVDDATGILGKPLLTLSIIGGLAFGTVLVVFGICYAWRLYKQQHDESTYKRGLPLSKGV